MVFEHRGDVLALEPHAPSTAYRVVESLAIGRVTTSAIPSRTSSAFKSGRRPSTTVERENGLRRLS